MFLLSSAELCFQNSLPCMVCLGWGIREPLCKIWKVDVMLQPSFLCQLLPLSPQHRVKVGEMGFRLSMFWSMLGYESEWPRVSAGSTPEERQ